MASLEIYLMSVGQADTSIIKTPAGNLVVIDAVRPKKVKAVLQALRPDMQIAHLIVTHPHNDHYDGVDMLLSDFHVQRVTLPPFWHEAGTAGYHALVNKMSALGTPVRFLSGYERAFPDSVTFPPAESELMLETLGPSNSSLDVLKDAGVLDPNHLSIITRLTYGRFSAVIAADAQMENWDQFDREGMFEKKCDVLRAAHHGSKRGSQWERLERLQAKLVVVSSDPGGRHKLPDLVGSAIFMELGQLGGRKAALTFQTGTIKIEAPASGDFTPSVYGEGPDDDLPAQPVGRLPDTDWAALLRQRLG
jgi:competence protein ComEC